MNRQLTRIAYVEDDPDIREITRMSLESLGGYEVAVYASGEEALEKIVGFNPDLILLDVMMPGMNGLEVLERLSGMEGVSTTPIVFMTAKTRPQELDTCRALGAVGVVSKPYDPILLPQELDAIWSEVATA